MKCSEIDFKIAEICYHDSDMLVSCMQCPYNRYQEYMDVGCSFGHDYFCHHPDYVVTDYITCGNRKIFQQFGKTKYHLAENIRENCPLEEKKDESK